MKKLLLFCLPVLASGPIFTWSFDQPTGVVDPTAKISMFATITNTSGSPETISWAGAILNLGPFFGIYQFDIDAISLLKLNNVPLAPGGTIGFNYGILSPTPPPVAPGTYAITFAAMTLCTDSTYSDCSTSQNSTNGFQRTVSAVPEPSSIGFLGAGLFFLGWRSRFRPLA